MTVAVLYRDAEKWIHWNSVRRGLGSSMALVVRRCSLGRWEQVGLVDAPVRRHPRKRMVTLDQL